MFCPYCHIEYETHSPCFCHPAPQRMAAAPEVEKPVVPEERLPPTGLDNPFWKPEAPPPGLASTPPRPPARPGVSV